MNLLLVLCLVALQPAILWCRSVDARAAPTYSKSQSSESASESWESQEEEFLEYPESPESQEVIASDLVSKRQNIAGLLVPLIERELSNEHRSGHKKKVIQVLPIHSSKEHARTWPRINPRKKHVVEITPLHRKGRDGKPLAYILAPAQRDSRRPYFKRPGKHHADYEHKNHNDDVPQKKTLKEHKKSNASEEFISEELDDPNLEDQESSEERILTSNKSKSQIVTNAQESDSEESSDSSVINSDSNSESDFSPDLEFYNQDGESRSASKYTSKEKNDLVESSGVPELSQYFNNESKENIFSSNDESASSDSSYASKSSEDESPSVNSEEVNDDKYPSDDETINNNNNNTVLPKYDDTKGIERDLIDKKSVESKQKPYSDEENQFDHHDETATPLSTLITTENLLKTLILDLDGQPTKHKHKHTTETYKQYSNSRDDDVNSGDHQKHKHYKEEYEYHNVLHKTEEIKVTDDKETNENVDNDYLEITEKNKNQAKEETLIEVDNNLSTEDVETKIINISREQESNLDKIEEEEQPISGIKDSKLDGQKATHKSEEVVILDKPIQVSEKIEPKERKETDEINDLSNSSSSEAYMKLDKAKNEYQSDIFINQSNVDETEKRNESIKKENESDKGKEINIYGKPATNYTSDELKEKIVGSDEVNLNNKLDEITEDNKPDKSKEYSESNKLDDENILDKSEGSKSDITIKENSLDISKGENVLDELIEVHRTEKPKTDVESSVTKHENNLGIPNLEGELVQPAEENRLRRLDGGRKSNELTKEHWDNLIEENISGKPKLFDKLDKSKEENKSEKSKEEKGSDKLKAVRDRSTENNKIDEAKQENELNESTEESKFVADKKEMKKGNVVAESKTNKHTDEMTLNKSTEDSEKLERDNAVDTEDGESTTHTQEGPKLTEEPPQAESTKKVKDTEKMKNDKSSIRKLGEFLDQLQAQTSSSERVYNKKTPGKLKRGRLTRPSKEKRQKYIASSDAIEHRDLLPCITDHWDSQKEGTHEHKSYILSFLFNK